MKRDSDFNADWVGELLSVFAALLLPLLVAAALAALLGLFLLPFVIGHYVTKLWT